MPLFHDMARTTGHFNPWFVPHIWRQLSNRAFSVGKEIIRFVLLINAVTSTGTIDKCIAGKGRLGLSKTGTPRNWRLELYIPSRFRHSLNTRAYNNREYRMSYENSIPHSLISSKVFIAKYLGCASQRYYDSILYLNMSLTS